MIKLFLKFSIGSWLSAAISLFTTPVITALILPDEFGKASMYVLAFNLIMQLALLGADQGFARKFYKEPSDEYQSKLLFNSIFIPALFSCFLAVVIFLFGDFISQLLINSTSNTFKWLLSLSIIVGVFERFALLLLRMKKRAIAYSVNRVLFSLVNFIVILLYASFISKDFFAIIYGNFISILFSSLLAIILVRKLWKFSSINKQQVKQVLIYGFPFLPTFLAIWVFEGIDKMALRHYTNFYEIGLFSAAYKIVAILSILQVAFSTFWTPVAFEMFEKGSSIAKENFSKALSYMCAVFFICGTGLILFKEIIILLFEKSYHTAAAIMPFLLLVPMMYTLSEVTVGGINYRNKTYWHLVIAVIAAVFNYILNILLVPVYAAKGAAIATGFSYILFFYARTLVSNYFFPLKIDYKRINLSLFVFITIGLLNTFYPYHLTTYLSTATAIIIFIVLYKKQFLFFHQLINQKFFLKSPGA